MGRFLIGAIPRSPAFPRVKNVTPEVGGPRQRLMEETFGIFIYEKNPLPNPRSAAAVSVRSLRRSVSRAAARFERKEEKTKEASMMRSEVRENDDADDDENERDDDNDDNILCVTSICLK